MIAIDMQLFSIAEDKGFNVFVLWKFLNISYLLVTTYQKQLWMSSTEEIKLISRSELMT